MNKLLNTFNRRIKGKKAISIWISWVLVMLFASLLSVVVYKWVSGLAGQTTKDLKRIYDTDECDQVSLRIENVCQDTQSLYTNITNNNELKIDRVLFRMFDVFNFPESTERNITITPGRTEEVQVFKQHSVKRLEIIPIMEVDGELVVCTKRQASSTVQVCS